MIHAHIALWIVGSPRIDKINMPKELPQGAIEVEVEAEDVCVMPAQEAANLMASFWDRVLTEWNVAKAFDVHKHTAAVPAGSADLREDPVDLLWKLCDKVGPRRAMGTKAERATISPECISSETLTRCLLQTPSVTEEQDRQCWQEFDDTMANCARCVEPAPDSISFPLGIGDEEAGMQTCSQAQRRARARSRFVAALAEWVNMHDYHEPFANGPPAAHQSCAAEDKGRLHFVNNFVPIIMLAMLSNCDFQATLIKDAVIEYMTKYMTKSGQGSLVKVMEQSFSLCVEKARNKNQGSGSAMLRWFNVPCITEVKSQLETMDFIFIAWFI